MKIKYLLPVLAGLTMVSCNQDEDLLSTNVQKGDYSPITFTVSKEGMSDAETRAWEDIAGTKPYFNFEAGDLLSLWNGMAWNSGSSEWTSIGQNAVFEGEGDGESLVFKTRSLVNAGTAILVYPADTAFYNKTANGLKIKVDADQNANTKQFLPYVSDVMNIGIYDENKGTSADNTAGYGRNYDVVLRQLGTLFAMNLNPTGGINFEAIGVAPIKYTAAQITNGTTKLFPTEVTVKQGVATSALKTYDKDLYAHFINETEVAAKDDTKAAAISTKDIADNATAYFTLLPQTSASAATTASITISTSYGFVTVENEATSTVGPLQNKAESAGATLAANLENVLNNTWKATENSKFGEEKQGRVIRRTLTFDLSQLDMDGLHIADENQLMDVLKVYDVVYANKEEDEKAVTFYLDGDKNGEFVMNAEAAAAYQQRVADEDNKISFKRCQEADTECTAIKFISATETEVPTVIIKPAETTAADGDKVNVILSGKWKFTTKNNYELVRSLIIDEDASVKFTGTVDANVASSITFSIINNGTVNVEGTTDLKLTMTNNGVININEGAELFVAKNDVVLTNEATSLTEFGEIYNNGNMGVRTEATGAKIYNYGFIEQKNANAYTYVSENETGINPFKAAFKANTSSANKIGTILLYGTGNYNTVVGENAKLGFIKVVITDAETVSDKEVGEFANYVEITGDCTAYTCTSDNVKYVEVKSNQRVVFNFTTPLDLTGLIIDKGYSINIPKGSTVKATTTYLKGYVYTAGTFTCTDFDGYLGGASTDNANVIYSGATGQ